MRVSNRSEKKGSSAVVTAAERKWEKKITQWPRARARQRRVYRSPVLIARAEVLARKTRKREKVKEKIHRETEKRGSVGKTPALARPPFPLSVVAQPPPPSPHPATHLKPPFRYARDPLRFIVRKFMAEKLLRLAEQYAGLPRSSPISRRSGSVGSF